MLSSRAWQLLSEPMQLLANYCWFISQYFARCGAVGNSLRADEQATVDGASDPRTNNPSIRGLGPAFNGDSCFMCHSFPTIGGTSPFSNPQVAVATAKGAQNALPPFVVLNGPVGEARCRQQRRRFGVLVRGSFSCMTGGRAICWRPSAHIRARIPRQTA